MRCAYLSLVKPPYNTMYYYNQFVRDAFMGDDNLVCVSDTVIDQFNFCTTRDWFAAFGLEMTSPLKGDDSGDPPYAKLDTYQFCKLTPRKDVEYKPVIDMETIGSLCNWIRPSENDYDDCLEHCNNALRFMYFAGREKFENLRKRMISEFEKMGQYPKLHCFGDLHQNYISDCMDLAFMIGYDHNERDDLRIAW